MTKLAVTGMDVLYSRVLISIISSHLGQERRRGLPAECFMYDHSRGLDVCAPRQEPMTSLLKIIDNRCFDIS